MIKNVKKGMITSIFGVLFLLGALVYSVYPMLFHKYEPNVMLLIVSSSIGIGLLLSPDNLIQALLEKLKK